MHHSQFHFNTEHSPRVKASSKTPKRGFTLLELLIVIAIIGILTTIVLASLNEARKSARDAKRLQEVREIATALNLYAIDNDNELPTGYFNSCSQGCDWLNTIKSQLEDYMSGGELPVDPVNDDDHKYEYVNSTVDNHITCDGEGVIVVYAKKLETKNHPTDTCPSGYSETGPHPWYLYAKSMNDAREDGFIIRLK